MNCLNLIKNTFKGIGKGKDKDKDKDTDKDKDKDKENNETLGIFQNKKRGNYEECVICLELMDYDDELIIIECSHIYHKDCLKQWLKKKKICPLCDYTI